MRTHTSAHTSFARGERAEAGDTLAAALTRMADGVAARSVAERERAEAAAEAARRAAIAERRFVRVPNALLGRVLDGGRASAYAAHLLALKVRHGAGFALQETHVACKYGIRERGFRAGIARLRDERVGAMEPADGIEPAGAIQRRQPTRRWAASAMLQILEPDARGWVGLPQRLLAPPGGGGGYDGPWSFVVALVLAVLLSPRPVRPADAAARFGVTSPTTLRALTRAAVSTGALVQTAGPRGAVLLGRPATVAPPRPTASARDPRTVVERRPVSGTAAPDPAIFVPARNVAPYRETADCRVDARQTPPNPHAAALRAPPRGSERVTDDDYLIEHLRKAGQPTHIVDLLAWFVDEGLAWWPDRLAVAQQLCTALAGASPRAIASVRQELLAGQTHRMPPLPLIVAAVRQAETQLREPSGRSDTDTWGRPLMPLPSVRRH